MAEAKPKLPTNDEAWISNSVWSLNQEKYNPDTLIGRRGQLIYKKMMLDEQVKAAAHFKRDAITSRDWFWEFDDSALTRLSEKEIARRKDINDAIVKGIKGSFTDKLNGIMSSLYNGFSLTEIVFNEFQFDKKIYWGINDLKLKPFDTFIFHTDEFGNIKKIVQQVGSKDIEITLNKFIHMIHQPDIDEHYGQSELREAYRAWFSKDKAILHYNIYLEKNASGHKVIRPVEGKILNSNTQEYTDLQNMLDNTTSGNGMIMPSKVEMDIHFPTGKVEYKTAIDMFDLHISRALLVPNLLGITPSGQTGSYSQSDTQFDAFLWTLDSDASRLEEVINEQLFRLLGEYNFGDEHWPRFKFKPLSDRQITHVLEVWQQMVEKRTVKPTEADENHIRNMLEFPERTEKDELLIDDSMEPDNGDGDVNIDDPAKKPDDNKPNPGDEKPTGVKQEETINGKLVRAYSIEGSKSSKRVAFAVIANTTDSIEHEHARNIGIHLYEMTERALAETDYEKANFKYSSGDKSKMQRIVHNSMKDGWGMGLKHATAEIDKAKGIEFTVKKDFRTVEKDYLQIKSLKATGKLIDDAKAIIENTILQGIKSGKTNEQIRLSIYAAFRSTGLLAEEVEKALGDALAGEALGQQVVNAQARIDTMVRTNVYEALNEARFNYFNAPELDGFVQAFEYSAILDSRTTQICQHLDGKVHDSGSDIWNTHRPPNHYNCRSILIPVTEVDKWSEDDPPDVQPQRGF